MARTIEPQIVLVVDDDRDFCRLVRALLEPAGYEVHDAQTATDALADAASEQPAAVLLDVHLPDISGYEVLRRLRDDFGDDVAVVFLSGERTEEFDRTGGMLMGADDYIVKPFAKGEFIARVRRAIDRSCSAGPEAAPRLTAREFEVLKLLAEGLDQSKISEELFITPKTVATHIQRILLKLDVHSRAEAVAYAHRNHLFNHR